MTDSKRPCRPPLIGGLVEGFVVGIEVKSSAGPRAGDFKGLQYLRARLGERFVAGIVLHTRERPLPFGDRLWALPISTLWTKQGAIHRSASVSEVAGVWSELSVVGTANCPAFLLVVFKVLVVPCG